MTLNCYILSFRDFDTACLTRMAVVHSKISFENFDPHKALAYLVIVAGREALIEAGLRHLISRWHQDRETGRNMDNWVFVPIKISKRDEIKIIAMLMEV